MTITINNGEPLQAEYEKALSGEEFSRKIPGTFPPVVVKEAQFKEKLTVKGMTFEVTRKVVTTGARVQETYEAGGSSFDSIEALAIHLLTT